MTENIAFFLIKKVGGSDRYHVIIVVEQNISVAFFPIFSLCLHGFLGTESVSVY